MVEKSIKFIQIPQDMQAFTIPFHEYAWYTTLGGSKNLKTLLKYVSKFS